MNEDLNGLMFFFSFSVSFQRERMCFLKKNNRRFYCFLLSSEACHPAFTEGGCSVDWCSSVFRRGLWLRGEVKPPPLPAGGSVPQRRLWRSWRQFKVKMAPQTTSHSDHLATRTRQQKHVIKVQERCRCEENLCWNIIGVGELVAGGATIWKDPKSGFIK